MKTYTERILSDLNHIRHHEVWTGGPVWGGVRTGGGGGGAQEGGGGASGGGEIPEASPTRSGGGGSQQYFNFTVGDELDIEEVVERVAQRVSEF